MAVGCTSLASRATGKSCGRACQAWECRRLERPFDLPQAMLPIRGAVRLGPLV